MLNFRKLKKDFSSAVLEQGKKIFAGQKVESARVVSLDPYTIKVSARIQGQYDNYYETEVEIDREECEVIDANCDCPESFDCSHLAALMQYMEENLNKILTDFSQENDLTDIEEANDIEDEMKEELLEQLEEAKSKEEQRRVEAHKREVLDEYAASSALLASSPFFRTSEAEDFDKAEFALILGKEFEDHPERGDDVEVQVALRLPNRSKPLVIPHLAQFFESVRYGEPLVIGGKKYRFGEKESFSEEESLIVSTVLAYTRPRCQSNTERGYRIGYLSYENLGMVLSAAFDLGMQSLSKNHFHNEEHDLPKLPSIFAGSLESPIKFSHNHGNVKFNIDYLPPPVLKVVMKPSLVASGEEIGIESVEILECAKPGFLYGETYYRFAPYVTRTHLRDLPRIRDMAIPEPLFGTFVENTLPQLSKKAHIGNRAAIENFSTLPHTKSLKAKCKLTFLDGALDAAIYFDYDGKCVPASHVALSFEDAQSFVSPEGILARNLVEERNLIDALFTDFQYNPTEGVFVTKSEKKIIEFMTGVLPKFQDVVEFDCPQNLLDQFIYDETDFELRLQHTSKVDVYTIDLLVNGPLEGVTVDQLWDCVASRRAFIELDKNGSSDSRKMAKILVLDMERISDIIQIFDELGITHLVNRRVERPLWSIANIDGFNFDALPIRFSISDELVEIRKQMLGEKELKFSPVPKPLDKTLRCYQRDGVQWLERIRNMFLSGILADDMGLGKTLQAIVAILQLHKDPDAISLIVCPTSLLYNWKEEFGKFAPHLKVEVIDGIPTYRKKRIDAIDELDVVITSYTLLQKDIEYYQKTNFTYSILDEAQHIKNRGTRNAKSVKMIDAKHRLVLSGTPIENSLDELWSLFDYLMPGFLSSFDRFAEKYVRSTGDLHIKNLNYLRKKVAPFILRRMKSEVLTDLPPVSELLYHCQLSPVQAELYNSYAESARNELTKLVERDGFDRVQIHVLATLTRLKQICCHPAIFAKEKAEPGDCAKYDMLLELLQTLIEGGHKTVIFSQYTRMLQIMRDDFEKMGIKYSYLDGSSKNRLEIVKEFNADSSITVFLVSLKAGGTGLNLVSADTVIHYDMWWNPAIESQATDRVHRIGQTRNVSAYKLVTLGTIEEKIAEMQERKKGLVKKVVSCDDEAIAKLTWEDVLELLKT